MSKEAKTLLNSELEAERCTGVEMLAAGGHPGGIELLAGRLKIEQSPYVRRRIICALGGTSCSFAAAVAVRLLSSPEAYVRNAALEILWELGGAALPSLEKIFNDPSRNLRKLAADALARIPGDAASSLLVAGLQDEDPNVVNACAEALGTRRDPRAIPALVQVLKQAVNVWVAFGIIESLANLDDTGVLDTIHEFVSRPGWDRRERIILAGIWAYAVSRLGDERSLPAAWEMYGRGDLTAQEMVLLLYGLHQRGIDTGPGDFAIESLLMGQLEKGSVKTLSAAAHLAAANCPALLYNFLPSLTERFSSNKEVIEDLTKALIQAGPSSTRLNSLLHSAADPLAGLVLSVAEQCEMVLSMEAIRELAGRKDLNIVRRAVALAWRCGAVAEAFLKDMADHPDREIAAAALSGLGMLGTGGALQLLLRSLEHPDLLVRRQAVDCLVMLSPAGLAGEIERLFERCPDFARPEVLEVMTTLKNMPLADAFQRAAAVADSELRARVARICRLIREDEVFFSVMETLANDPDQEVRRIAILSMSSRTGEGVYRLLSYLYNHDPCKMHRYFILSCPEIYRHQGTFEWLVENIELADPLLRLAAVRGMGRMGEAGRQYLRATLESPLGDDEDLAEIIQQELEKNGGGVSDSCA